MATTALIGDFTTSGRSHTLCVCRADVRHATASDLRTLFEPTGGPPLAQHLQNDVHRSRASQVDRRV